VALFFGYVRHYKGLDTLLTAWKRVRAVRPGATLVVAGEFYEDPAAYEGAYEVVIEPAGPDQPGNIRREKWIRLEPAGALQTLACDVVCQVQ
jgi:glycosyltransferase involved in cell wall biosynthesis